MGKIFSIPNHSTQAQCKGKKEYQLLQQSTSSKMFFTYINSKESKLQTLVHLGQIPMARSTQLPLYIVGRMTNNGPPQTSFHMTSLFRCHSYHLYCDVSCFTWTRVISDLTVQTPYSRRYNDVIDIEIPTSHFVGLHYMCAMGVTFPYIVRLT
jgi:hypothetical protein